MPEAEHFFHLPMSLVDHGRMYVCMYVWKQGAKSSSKFTLRIGWVGWSDSALPFLENGLSAEKHTVKMRGPGALALWCRKKW